MQTAQHILLIAAGTSQGQEFPAEPCNGSLCLLLCRQARDFLNTVLNCPT